MGSSSVQVGNRPQRSTHRKVRSGCKTCKFVPPNFSPPASFINPLTFGSSRQRHVKCDETKPKCSRCLTFGVDCDGYIELIPPKSPTLKRITPKRSILPQQSRICELSARPLFKTQQEYRYFQFFCSQTTHSLTGYFSPKLWQTVVLQACETDPPIRHAAVALGALDFNLSQFDKYKFTRQHYFALKEYNKAVLQIRKRVAGRKIDSTGSWDHQNLRFTLIACLLFACFESFHGSLDTAITQIHAGVRMIEEWMVTIQTCRGGFRSMSSVSSPKSNIIEDELIQIFARVDLESLSSRQNSSLEWQHYQRYFGQQSMDAMPAKFVNLAEARAYQELIQRREMHWMPWIDVKPGPSITLRFHYVQDMNNCNYPEEVLRDKTRYLAEGTKWAQAFKPLWTLSQSEGGETLYMGAIVLKIQELVGQACRSSVACSREFLYVQSVQYLREIIHLAREVIEWTKARSACSFSLDAHVIYPLVVVGLRFRHRALRREAIDLLQQKCWREGVWDSWVFGEMLQFVADVEDEGLADVSGGWHEHVPEDRVAREVQMQHNVAGRKTTVSCLQPVGNKEVHFVPRMVVIPWK
jgi:hypothetical protein